MTIRKFMIMDLIVLSVIAVLVDLVGYMASQTDLAFFYLMLSFPIMLIGYIRWNVRALWINLVVMVLHVILYGVEDGLGMLVYVTGILMLGLPMIYFKFFSKRQIREEVLLLTVYYLTGYAILFFSQVLAQSVIGEGIQWINMMIRHGINLFLGWVILMIASKQEDLMVDMHQFLLRTIEERKDEGLQR